MREALIFCGIVPNSNAVRWLKLQVRSRQQRQPPTDQPIPAVLTAMVMGYESNTCWSYRRAASPHVTKPAHLSTAQACNRLHGAPVPVCICSRGPDCCSGTVAVLSPCLPSTAGKMKGKANGGRFCDRFIKRKIILLLEGNMKYPQSTFPVPVPGCTGRYWYRYVPSYVLTNAYT